MDEILGNYNSIYKSICETNIHEKNKDCLSNMKRHSIFYGPKGLGKYSNIIYQIYKNNNIQYLHEKKLNVDISSKQSLILKTTSLFCELDFKLIHINNKNNIFQILDLLNDSYHVKHNKKYYILCKNFECIQNELLEIFYSFMKQYTSFIFIIHTSNIGFIPHSILHICDTYCFNAPTLKMLKKIGGRKLNTKNIENMLQVNHNIPIKSFKLVDEIYTIMTDYNSFDYMKLRENLYNVLVYHRDIYSVFLKILQRCFDDDIISIQQYIKIQDSIIKDFSYYNNNYRPIFHLEKIFLTIVREIYNEL